MEVVVGGTKLQPVCRSFHSHTTTMSSNDVRSILNLTTNTANTNSKKSSATVKRPDGISRELYALIGDNAPSLAQASAATVKYKEKPKPLHKKARW
jgi:DNA methyltransferase 1-associated protein 1